MYDFGMNYLYEKALKLVFIYFFIMCWVCSSTTKNTFGLTNKCSKCESLIYGGIDSLL